MDSTEKKLQSRILELEKENELLKKDPAKRGYFALCRIQNLQIDLLNDFVVVAIFAFDLCPSDVGKTCFFSYFFTCCINPLLDKEFPSVLIILEDGDLSSILAIIVCLSAKYKYPATLAKIPDVSIQIHTTFLLLFLSRCCAMLSQTKSGGFTALVCAILY